MAEKHDFVLTSVSSRKNLRFSLIAEGLSRVQAIVEAENSVLLSLLGVHWVEGDFPSVLPSMSLAKEE
jgi:hypothetical protein